ncbi:MAG: L-seryl-tRNA(Sec) selenium transferase [Spirochaeta sp.]|nr:L-seryl-tRNA(Sec) selenium transferase [Spirochaeta sp.]
MKRQNLLAQLPQIEKLLSHQDLNPWFHRISRPLVSKICQKTITDARKSLLAGNPASSLTQLIEKINQECNQVYNRRIRRVINATGIILHTNMGRSPLPASIWQEAAMVNTTYSNLEFNLQTGKRGSRGGLVPELLSLLTRAESALVVNNNAAAVFLMLSALAGDKEVIVSRGEQIQIGGGFRIPDILALSGSRLVEVGTTNITTTGDYLSAASPDTAMALSVHPSNFVMAGFTAKPTIAELSSNLPRRVILAVDQGSGVTTEQISGETSIIQHIRDGADLVCFSGDKVLGGPQSGIIVGNGKLLEKMRKHPLMRIFRPGKTILSLLEEFLIRKLNKEESGHTDFILNLPEKELKLKAQKILRGLKRDCFSIVPSTMLAGGGSSPAKSLISWAIKITLNQKAADILKQLRENDPPIIGIIKEDSVHLNTATLLPEDTTHIRNALKLLLPVNKP